MAFTAPLFLGIESSCDDTAAAVVDGAGRVLSSVVSRQVETHRPFGGVVPEMASREHLRNWPAVSAEALEKAGASFQDLGAIAATKGPGLIGSLLVGLSIGRGLAYGLKVPFFAVHHLEGHLYSPFLGLDGSEPQAAPTNFHGLVVSGGHTVLYRVSPEGVETLAETRDDAFGEVFDKVGKRLGFPYPQGPMVDELAEEGSDNGPKLSIARCSDGSLDFSFSGLKSQTLLEIEKLEKGEPAGSEEAEQARADLAASFRRAAVGQIVDRLDKLRKQGHRIETLAVSGGAAANLLLRRRLTSWASDRRVDLRLVPLAFSGDNAAMIAHAALLRQRLGECDDPLHVEASSRLPLAG